MILDLEREEAESKSVKAGDVLVFSNGNEQEYYMVIRGQHNMDKTKVQLLSLDTATVVDSLQISQDIISDFEGRAKNGFKPIEIIRKSNLKLSRVD